MKFRKDEELPPCEVCLSGKLTASRFPASSQKDTVILDIVLTDICGPMRTESRGKVKYFITFIDDCSRWTTVYFLRNKNDALRVFKEFKEYVEKQGRRIKRLQSDNGREFCNREFDDYLKKARHWKKTDDSIHTATKRCGREEESNPCRDGTLYDCTIRIVKAVLGGGGIYNELREE